AGSATLSPSAVKRASAGFAPSGPRRDLRRRVHQLTHQIVTDMDRLHLNTAVSGMMQYVNALDEFRDGGGDLTVPEVTEAMHLGGGEAGRAGHHRAGTAGECRSEVGVLS